MVLYKRNDLSPGDTVICNEEINSVTNSKVNSIHAKVGKGEPFTIDEIDEKGNLTISSKRDITHSSYIVGFRTKQILYISFHISSYYSTKFNTQKREDNLKILLNEK